MLQVSSGNLWFFQAWEVHAQLTAGIANGEVVPLPLNKFSHKEAANAFRFMAAGALLSVVQSILINTE